jgi:hypothetical protein
MNRTIRKNITTLLLGLILVLPSLVLADHLHETFVDETNCELCSFSSPAVTADAQPQQTGSNNHQQLSVEPVRLPFALFRLNKHQRGPPLLS